MQRRSVWTLKQGAAGLMASVIGVLIALSVPAPGSDAVDASRTSQYSAATVASFSSPPSEPLMRNVPASGSSLGSRSFHSVDQITSPNSLSGGALGMVLLGLFSLALFIAALLFRGPLPRNDS